MPDAEAIDVVSVADTVGYTLTDDRPISSPSDFKPSPRRLQWKSWRGHPRSLTPWRNATVREAHPRDAAALGRAIITRTGGAVSPRDGRWSAFSGQRLLTWRIV